MDTDVDAIKFLKLHIIEQYNLYTKRLNLGYKDDYTNIMNMINYLEVCRYLDNKQYIYEKLTNNEYYN